jgi:hypothetical protein
VSVGHVTNDQIVFRSALGDQAIVVALNLADEPSRVPVEAAGEVLAGRAGPGAADAGEIVVPGNGWAVLRG